MDKNLYSLPKITTQQLDPEEIRFQLNEILNSSDFPASQRLKNLLTYIVDTTLQDKVHVLKAYTIAVEVFKLNENFDPRVSTLVRTEIGRLRSKLDYYYRRNPNTKIQINIPKGSYVAEFKKSESSAAEESQPAPVQSISPTPQTFLNNKETILVLPFENIGSSEEMVFFTTGLLKELISSLTKFKDLSVVDRTLTPNSSLLHDDEVIKLASNYNARFILGGGSQIEEGCLKLWINLRDAVTFFTVWSERFKVELDSKPGFKLQEELAEAIIYRIAGEFGIINHAILKEYIVGKKATSIIEQASLLYAKWTAVLHKQAFEEALPVLEQAVAEHPDNTILSPMLADLYIAGYQYSYVQGEENLDRAMQMATKIIAFEPENQMAQMILTFNHFLHNDKESFAQSALRTANINPAGNYVLSVLSTLYGLVGMWDESLLLTEKLLNLNPASPGWCHHNYALFNYVNGNYEEAFAQAQKIKLPATLWDALLRLVSSANLGKKAEAKLAWDNILEIYPEFDQQKANIIKHAAPDPDYIELLLSGVEKAKKLICRS